MRDGVFYGISNDSGQLPSTAYVCLDKFERGGLNHSAIQSRHLSAWRLAQCCGGGPGLCIDVRGSGRATRQIQVQTVARRHSEPFQYRLQCLLIGRVDNGRDGDGVRLLWVSLLRGRCELGNGGATRPSANRADRFQAKPGTTNRPVTKSPPRVGEESGCFRGLRW